MNPYHTEFYTTQDGRHRIEIEVRDGHPGPYHRERCERLAEYLHYNNLEHCQIVSLFDDDTHCYETFTVGTDCPEDLQNSAEDCLQSFFNSGNISVHFELVEPGNKMSDHYDPAEYIRRAVARL